jgi:hypothetical protein
MARLATRFPQYGWETNAGYGTPAHCQAMARVGISPHHRRAFAPVRAILQGTILLPEPTVEETAVAAPAFDPVSEAGSTIVLNTIAL